MKPDQIKTHWSDEDAEWVATSPAWPGLSILEATPQKAVSELQKVIRLALTVEIPRFASLSHEDVRNLESLTPDQIRNLDTARQWIHDYNLGKAPKPNFNQDFRLLVSAYSEMMMAREVLGL